MNLYKHLMIALFMLIVNATSYSQKTYKILALGDVITTGNSANGIVSYIFPLWEKLLAAGYVVEFIGPNNTSTRIGNLKQAAISNETGTAENIANTISNTYNSYKADIVLLHAGHNYDAANNPVQAIITAHKSIISKIRAINPDVKILVAQVIPAGKLPKYSYITDLNAQLALMSNEYLANSKPIALVNMSENFNWQTDCVSNMVHPNAIGADKIAQKWANALKTMLDAPDETYYPEIVTYKQPTGAPLKLHIFKPNDIKPAEKRPAIVYFFGGGWTSGTPLQFYREAHYWASKGMIAICADYRIQSTHGTTAIESIKDAKSVIRWMRENADKYNINPDKICASGASAGGHLAAATATLKLWDEPTENATLSSKPNLLLLNYPVIDNGPTGYGPTDFRAQYITVSPLHNIDQHMPPCLVFLGTADPLIPVSTAQLFQQKMKDFNIESDLILYQGAGHPIFSYQKGKTDDYYRILNQSEAFLTKHGYVNLPNASSITNTINECKTYPNPASNYFYIEGIENGKTVSIIDLKGTKHNVPFKQNKYDSNDMPIGMYLISVENKNIKLIINR